MSTDRERGLYRKYHTILRSDGESSLGGKHHKCEYFVLDLTHDPHAHEALLAYIESCKEDYPALAIDLTGKAANMMARGVFKP